MTLQTSRNSAEIRACDAGVKIPIHNRPTTITTDKNVGFMLHSEEGARL